MYYKLHLYNVYKPQLLQPAVNSTAAGPIRDNVATGGWTGICHFSHIKNIVAVWPTQNLHQ